MIEHRGSSDESSQNKDERLFPVASEEFFVGEHEHRQEDDEDERRHTEGDIGVGSEAENESGDQEVRPFAGAEASKKEVKGKGKEEGYHNGSEADAGEIDRPI